MMDTSITLEINASRLISYVPWSPFVDVTQRMDVVYT